MKRNLLTTFLFTSVLFFGFATNVYAGTIYGHPTYIGLSSGLVGSWSFDGRDLYRASDLGQIRYASDRSGQGNDGTLNGSATPGIGKIGQALSFLSSTPGSVNMGTPSVLNNLAAFSASAWINFDTVTGDKRIVGKCTGVANCVGWRFFVNGSNNRLFFGVDYDVTNLDRVSISNTVLPNEWYHVVVTWDGSATAANAHIYVNGSEVSYTSTVNGDTSRADDSTTDFVIGAAANGTADNFSGEIDDVRIYNRVLSPDEIKRLYKIGATLKLGVAPQNLNRGLAGLFSFDGNGIAGLIAYDSSGNNNSGTLTGGPVKAIGKIGQALNFDGVDDYVEVPDGSTNSLDVTGALTASVWFKMNNNPVNQSEGLINKFRSQTGFLNERAYAIIVNTTGTINATISSDGTNVPDSTSASATGAVDRADGGWHLATMVFIPSTSLTLYVDGAQEAQDVVSVPASIFNSPAPFWIGLTFNSTDTERYANALIDEARIYSRALTPDEIKRLYKIGATLKTGVAPQNLNSGLVGSWSFDGKDMANLTAYDRSGSNNNGTLTNGPARVIGKIGQALNFDGVNDYVDAGTNASLDDAFASSGGGGTISAWIYPRTIGEFGGAAYGIIVAKGVPGAWFWSMNSSNNLRFLETCTDLGGGAVNRWQTPTNSITLNAWQHVALVYSNSSVSNQPSIYINGVKVSATQDLFADDNPCESDAPFNLTIGNDANGIYTFDGPVDEVRVYNRVLSADEIKRLYNMGR